MINMLGKMSSVFHVMKEEHDRLEKAEELYLTKIAELPRGTPRIKRVNNSEYLYLNRREGTKVVDEYIGRADSEKAHEVLELIKKRDKLIAQLKQVRAQLKEVKAVLRGKYERF